MDIYIFLAQAVSEYFFIKLFLFKFRKAKVRPELTPDLLCRSENLGH
jgi:hypothetical protein